jgi:ribosomal protein S18 acetylase RimI-like enzyme
LVLDDGTGRAVGYCIGTADTAGFCRRWKTEFVRSLDRERKDQEVLFDEDGDNEAGEGGGGEAKRKELLEIIWSAPEKGCDGDVVGLWEEFPSHLHIDILPSYQRQGWGAQLIMALLQQLQHEGSRGVYLGVGASNTGAVKFYERLGFGRYSRIEQNGEVGRKGDTMILTKHIP